MKDLNKNIDLIERYLDEDLNQQEMAEFNHRLNTDPEFNQLFFEMDRLMEGIRISARQTAMEEKLARLEQALPVKKKYVQDKKSQSILTRIIDTINYYLDRAIATVFNLDQEEMVAVPVNDSGQASGWAVASKIKVGLITAITMIIIATILIITQFPGMTPMELYSSNYEKPELYVYGVRSAEPEKTSNLTPEEILNKANLEYNNANYGKAISLLNTVPDEEKLPGMLYCSALSNIETENFERAKELLTLLIEEDDIVWKERANWFMALTLIREEETEQAEKYLRFVSEIEGGEYQSRAKQLLEKIND